MAETPGASAIRTQAFSTMGENPTPYDLESMQPVELGDEVLYGSPVYNEIMSFLIKEAYLLDHDRFDDWVELLAEDLRYTAPVRRTVWRRQGLGYDDTVGHFDDDYASIKMRVLRLAGDTAWAEDPPSRVRRNVGNAMIYETTKPGEYAVMSNLVALRNRWDSDTFDIISCGREDLLRRDGTSFKLARRRILVDQALLGTPNLAIFL
jgi:3-phenylpropionate/cinnamic acid dioxygenase small subunit